MNIIAEMRLWNERFMGEMLAATIQHEGGRPSNPVANINLPRNLRPRSGKTAAFFLFKTGVHNTKPVHK
jgi:hypothetical protein